MEQEKKNTKKTIDSYLNVLSTELGREPSFDEFKQYLSKQATTIDSPVAKESKPIENVEKFDENQVQENPQQNDSLPKILKIKIFYGLSDKDGQKSPDPDRVLYYTSPEGYCYDCKHKKWLDETPAVLDHLHSRPIESTEKDIIRAIAHGIMDEDDINALNNKGLISDSAMLLWDKIKKLNQLYSEYDEMNKADPAELEDPIHNDEIVNTNDDSYTDTEIGLQGDSFIESADLDDENAAEIFGEDNLTKIIQLAFAEPKNKEIIRSMIQEEIQNFLKEELLKKKLKTIL